MHILKRSMTVLITLSIMVGVLSTTAFGANVPTATEAVTALNKIYGEGTFSATDDAMTMNELVSLYVKTYGFDEGFFTAGQQMPDGTITKGSKPDFPFMRGNLAYILVKIYDLSILPIDSHEAWGHLDKITYADFGEMGYPANKEAIYICKDLGITIPQDSSDVFGFEKPVTKAEFAVAAYGAEQKAIKFPDVKKDSIYYNAIKFAYQKGITSGIDGGKYGPDVSVTRGQFITMLCRAYGISEKTGDNFADAGNTYYTGYLAAAKQLGISGGVGDNKYAPDRIITLEEMYTIAYNAIKVLDAFPKLGEGKPLSSYSDGDKISPWAQEAMKTFSEHGVIVEFDGKLTPKTVAKREVMAQLFFNLIGK